MFQKLRNYLSYANVAATLALVFALTGGAFAATSHSSGGSASFKATASATPVATVAKTKKKAAPRSTRGPAGPKGATGATGTTGATGPAGATGPGGSQGSQGPAGTNGINGTNGEPGKNGESVTSKAFAGKKEKCAEGGSEFTAAEGKKTYACNGEKGVIHPGETLAPEATETGVWSFDINQASIPAAFGSYYLNVPVASFTIPLAASLPEEDVHYINQNGEEVTDSGPVSGTPAECKGSADKPTAEPGNFCVYAHEEDGVDTDQERILNPGNLAEGAGTTGAIERFYVTESAGVGIGTWAVTAPTGS